MVTRLNSHGRCYSAGRVTAQLLLSFLALPIGSGLANASPNNEGQAVLPTTPIPIFEPILPDSPAPAEHTFTLRHVYHHGTNRHPTLHRKKDIVHKPSRGIYLAAEDGYGRLDVPSLRLKSWPGKIERLVDRRPGVVDPMVATARQNGFVTALEASAWTIDELPTPNITDKETVLNLAFMSADAYCQDQEEAEWEEVGTPFNKSADFGWEGDGLRGHIFADETNSTIIIGLKGTSMAYFDGEGTTTNDKVNDNLFFSCCCGQQGQWTYHQVCDCATDTYTCNNTCVLGALKEENRYYKAGRELYANVTELYPDAIIWMTGHSLGGAVTSLLGMTYGIPAVTFEAVPEALPAGRLGFPTPPHSDPANPQVRDLTGAYHFGHTADPVYIGTCSGAAASCSYFGYAMESQCHTGYECVYDVVADKGWRVGIGTHRIRSVINDVITKYDTVPECKMTPECRDCNKWKMYWSNGTESTTTGSFSSTAAKTRTRTETCMTPGWWGCLDESTTTTSATSTTTSSSSTSTCKTPGWFGCKDKTTTETTTTSSSSSTPTSTTASTTCETPGRFWGCYDESTSTTSIVASSSTPTPSLTSPPSTSAIPTTRELEKTSTSTLSSSCLHRSWFGRCKEWGSGDVKPEPTQRPEGLMDEM
ncbi:triacylglycerol lipase [Zalerion maritima]|uniref:triacylglycerol lipase n=1 Tax=Zalerion maritima TaxID=339359 RepID=A0AAD5WUK1_9PEZI|nr:triacylglycerol lipase [Zalerion maritima]